MNTLAAVLRKPLQDNDYTRAYQQTLDAWVDGLKTRWDLKRGLIASRGIALPHETTPGYWSKTNAQRRRLCSPQARKIYAASSGRSGTAPLCAAAFCWYSPLSRHHHDPELLQFFAAGFDYFVSSINAAGEMSSCGLNGEYWAHGWDIEGLIYGMIFCREALDKKLLAKALERFRLSARRHAAHPKIPALIGSIGNQRAVWILGLHLYGQILKDKSLIALADRWWEDVLPCVLDESGQVIEQMGPCMHYSYTAFFYAWLNLVVRGDTSQLPRVARCLEWFRMRHTRSLYPIAGPSTRRYYESIHPACDLLAAASQVAGLDPALRRFVLSTLAVSQDPPPAELSGATGHGASPLMWAILMAPDEQKVSRVISPEKPAIMRFVVTHFIKRSPMQYMLVHHDYQTHYNFTDFLPFSGVQTWALGDEPPIIHPTPLAPSTTQAYRVDTARQGASHNWGLYGAGAVGIDGYSHAPKTKAGLRFLVARYDWLWRLVFFTLRSTVILEFGKGGARQTLWTLNRLAPAKPQIEKALVRFQGRKGCLHSTLARPPVLKGLKEQDEWATGVRQLIYECKGGAAAFALSDDSFRFAAPPPQDSRPWRFADARGKYEVVLDRRFFQPNPGNFRVDPFQLAKGTTARMIS